MNIYGFVMVVIDSDKIILCKRENFNSMKESDKQLLIRKAFKGTNLRKRNLTGFKRKIPYKVKCFCNTCSSRFIDHVKQLKEGNDWEEYPFMVLLLYKKYGVSCCATGSVDF